MLSALSRQMLSAQENEKRRIAVELHVRVAQTLSAVKLGAEAALVGARSGRGDPAGTLEAIVPALHAATQDIRAVAVDLRPSSLDDLGLLPTLRWLCRQCAEKHSHIAVEHRFRLQERNIPLSLREIIYQAAEDACTV